MKFLFKIISVFIVISFISCSFAANGNTATETSNVAETLSDAMIIRSAIMGFVSENSQREAGEGLLYLASHYKELKQYPRARDYLKRILRAEVINPAIKWEAMLLDAEICKEIKDYEEIRCSKCVNNLIAYIKKLEKELLILKNERFDKDYERIERELKV